MIPQGRPTSGAAQAKVKAASPVDRWVLDRMLAKPTSLILAVPSLVSRTFGDFRSCQSQRLAQKLFYWFSAAKQWATQAKAMAEKVPPVLKMLKPLSLSNAATA